jgi:hypothetical protein
MKLSDETRAGVPHNGAAGVSEERAAGKPSPGLIEVLGQFGEEILASVNGLIEVKSDRIRLSVRRTIVKVALATGATLCVCFWLAAASLATLRGMCGGFTALAGGNEWFGDLCGGVLALALAAGAVALSLQLSTRRELNRLESKYERIRNKSGTSDDRELPPEDGGAAARSRGSAGDPAHQRGGATLR